MATCDLHRSGIAIYRGKKWRFAPYPEDLWIKETIKRNGIPPRVVMALEALPEKDVMGKYKRQCLMIKELLTNGEQ